MFGEEDREVADAGAPVGVFGFGGVEEECEVCYCLEGRGVRWAGSKIFRVQGGRGLEGV